MNDIKHVANQPCTDNKRHKLGQVCNIQTETHLHLITVKEVDVWFVLVLVLTHEQQHGGVTCLIQHCLRHLDGGERKVLQLFLQENNRISVTWREVAKGREQDTSTRNSFLKHVYEGEIV